MYTPSFRHRLTELLARHGLSGREFDRQIGIALGSSWSWTDGASEPTISYAYRKARVYGYRVEDLVSDQALPPPSLEPQPVDRAVLVKEVGQTRFNASLRHLLEVRRQSGRAFARESGLAPSTVRTWLDARASHGSGQRLSPRERSRSASTTW